MRRGIIARRRFATRSPRWPPIHSKSKDQLAGDDLREQRRFRRLPAAAIAGLAVLTVVTVVAAVVAFTQRQEAIRQGKEANQMTPETCACRAKATPEVTIVSVA